MPRAVRRRFLDFQRLVPSEIDPLIQHFVCEFLGIALRRLLIACPSVLPAI